MHHAYIYEGPLAHFEALVADACTRFGFNAHGDPDIHTVRHEKFGIDEARTLQSVAGLRSVSGRALFVIGAVTMPTEAQQALLKLFEEPQEGLVFVLLVPHGSIIGTLRSRVLPYPATFETGERKISVKEFLAATPKARSSEIIKLLKDDSSRAGEAEAEEGARERVRAFLQALEDMLHVVLRKTKGKQEIRESLEDIAKVRSYLNDRSASLKMLLEHLAVSVPRI